MVYEERYHRLLSSARGEGMIEKDDVVSIVERHLQIIIDELNNHVTREAYEKLNKERKKIVGLLVKASGL